MKKKDARHIDDLLRLFEGKMSEQEGQDLRSRLDASVSSREEFAQLSEAYHWLQEGAAHSASSVLKPFFTDRLMRRVNQAEASGSRDEDMATMLAQVFRPVALASLVLAVFLAAYNIRLSKDYSIDSTTVESVLALPPVTSMSAFDLDLYAAESVLYNEDEN